MSHEAPGTGEEGLTRRQFLQVGAAGAVGAAAVGGGVWWFARDRRGQWERIFGDRTDLVAEVGRRAVEAGVVASVADALDGLPTDGLRERNGSVEVTDADALTGAVHTTATEQLAADEMIALDHFLFAPTELSLAALVYLS